MRQAELALGLYAKINQYLQDELSKFTTRLSSDEDIKKKDRQEITQNFNQLLQDYGMPGLAHQLYASQRIDRNKKGDGIYKPRYKPSKKYPGYYVRINHSGIYQDENNMHTSFYKSGPNGEMMDQGLLNSKK